MDNVNFTKDELKIFTRIYTSNWSSVPKKYEQQNYYNKNLDSKIEQFISDNRKTTEIDITMWAKINVCLIDNFDRMSMPLPDNYEDIMDYVYWDIYNSVNREDWDVNKVCFSFRKWIES